MATVNLITNPGTYSPINAEVWFNLNSASSSVSDFKYVVDVNKVDPISSIRTSLGRYRIPPRPSTGYGLFSPHKLLRTQVSYDLQPFIYKIATASKSIVKYGINYGFQYNIGETYTDTYSGTGNRLGLIFTATSSFLPGDIITIDKNNKQSNPQYDGTCSVYAVYNLYPLFLLETDKQFVSSTINDGGQVSNILRMVGTSSDFYGYNGTRQYDEIKTNFSNTLVTYNNANTTNFLSNYRTNQIGNPTSYADFSTNYDYLCKKIYSNQYETLSFMSDVSILNSNELFIYVSAFDRLGNLQLGFFTSSISPNYRRYDLPAGPQNLVNGGYFASTQSQVIYNGGFTSSLGGWGNTSSNNGGNYSTFSIATNQAVYDGQFDSDGLTLINNVTSFTPGVNYNFSLQIVTASSPYNNLECTFWLGTNNHQFTTSEIYATGTYSFNLIAGGTQAKIGVGTDGQGGKLVLDNLRVTRGDLPEYYMITIADPITGDLKAARYYHIVDNCSPYPTNFRIAFLNRHGAFDYWNFNWKNINTLNTSKNEFRKVLDYNYNVGDRQDTVLSQKANETFNISSDWITEYDSKYLKELITSPEVYHINEDDGVYYPIIITDTSYQVKTAIDNKLFCINVTFKYAYDINLQQS